MFINNNYMCFTHSSSLTSCQLIFSSVPEMLARIYSLTHTHTHSYTICSSITNYTVNPGVPQHYIYFNAILHDFTCHPYAGPTLTLLCIVPTTEGTTLGTFCFSYIM